MANARVRKEGDKKLRILHLTAIIRRENPVYVAWCPELDIASQGKTIDSAIRNLKRAVELYLEDEDVEIPEELFEYPEEMPTLTCFNVGISK